MRYLKSAKCLRELKQNGQPNIHVTYTKPCIYGEKKQIQLLWRFHYIIAKKFNCGYINGKYITPQLYRTMKGAILHGDIKQFYNFLDNIGVKYIRESIEETVLKSTIRKSRNTDHGGYILKSKLRGIKKLNGGLKMMEDNQMYDYESATDLLNELNRKLADKEIDLPIMNAVYDYILEGARSELRGLKSQFVRLYMYLLKWQFHPERQSASWYDSITNAIFEINLIIYKTNSLRNKITRDFMIEAYNYAREEVAKETRKDITMFPSFDIIDIYYYSAFDINYILDLDYVIYNILITYAYTDEAKNLLDL